MRIYTLDDSAKDRDNIYLYNVRDDKEQRLLDALNYALEDACPPDKEDYLCMMDESEEQRCKECWIRWATLPYGRRKK